MKAITALIRATVHRWSFQPCTAYPRANSFSNSANWPSESLGSFGGPAEARASIPPRRQTRRQRSTDRSLTRGSFAITTFFSPRANRSQASYRIRSRNRRRSAVSPPPCAYHLPPAHRRDQHTSPRQHPEEIQ